MAIKDWSTTAAGNSTVGSINWAEGQAPSTVNDSAREMMAELATVLQAQANVKDYGAVGDGATDDTSAIQSAYNSLTSGGVLNFSPGTYRTTGKLTFTASNVLVIGYGATIESTDHTESIIRFGGRYSGLQGLSLQFDSRPTAGESDALGLELWNVANCSFRDILIKNTYNAISIAQADATGSGTNFAFSCSLDNVRVQSYVNYGIYWQAFGSANTGSVFNNVYVSNIADDGVTRQSCAIPVYLGSTVSGVFNQLNIEHCKVSQDIIFISSDSSSQFNVLHLEGVEPVNSNTRSIFSMSSDAIVEAVDISMIESYFQSANMSNNFAIAKLNDRSKIHINGFRERNNTIDITGAVLLANFASIDADSSAIFEEINFVTSTGGNYTTVWDLSRTAQPAISGLYRTVKWFNGRDYDTALRGFAASDTTPSVLEHSIFKTANAVPTTISMFDDGYSGQVIHVLIFDNNTTIDFTGTNLLGNAGVDWNPAANDSMTCVFNGTSWHCDISDNTA